MFGIDIFNYGHTLTTFGGEVQGPLLPSGQGDLDGDGVPDSEDMNPNDPDVGRQSWFSGDKIKIVAGCLINEYKIQKTLTDGNSNTSQITVDMGGKSKKVLSTAELPGGSNFMKAMYIPNSDYIITILTTNGEEIVVKSAKNIGCFTEAIDGSVGDSLGMKYGDGIESIIIEDKSFIPCSTKDKAENEDGSCGNCLDSFTLDEADECVSCESINQEDGVGGRCGNCLEGFIVDEDTDNATYGTCIEVGAKDNSILYAGGGLIFVAIVATLMKKK